MDLLPFLMDDGLNIRLIENMVQFLLDPIPGFSLEIRERYLKNRNEEYYEKTIPSYTGQQFKEYFRMSRATCQDLLNIVGNKMGVQEDTLYVPLEKKILFTIWMLSKPESFLAGGDRFGLPSSSGHSIFKEIIEILAELMPQYIKFPNSNEQELSAKIFEARSNGFPGVIGAIDGCHIPCKQPVGNITDFYNRKGFHSIILQGVCDHQCRFIDIFIGMPGRMHDARVFKSSPIYKRLISNVQGRLLSNEYHLIGDSAYPLSKYLLTPYRDNGHLTGRQKKYNIKLSSIRSTIERAFGLLKIKFRRLKYLDITDFTLGNKMIAAACLLHNLIIDHNDVDLQNDLDLEDLEELNNFNNGIDEYEQNTSGQTKRNSIADML